MDQDGVVINGGYKRYQGRFQIDQKLGQKFRIGMNTNYTYSIKEGQIANLTSDDITTTSAGNASSFLMYSTWGYRPVIGSGNIDDFINDPFDGDITSSVDLRVNPVVNAKNKYNFSFTKSLYANAFIEYAITKQIKLKSTGGFTDAEIRTEQFNNSNTAAGNPATVYGSTYGINGSILNLHNKSILNENTISFNKTYNKIHRIDAVAGFTMQKNSTGSDGYTAILLPNESLGINGLAQGTVLKKIYTNSYSTLVSFLGRINYAFNSKYLFTASFRSDGSSKFSPDKRWGYFPSGAIGWNIDKEDFFKNIRFISSAKLRS